MTGSIKINIVLQKQDQKYPLLITQTVKVTQKGQIMLNQIILRLKQSNFNQIFSNSVSYYSHSRGCFIFGFYISPLITQSQLCQAHSCYSLGIPLTSLQSSSQPSIRLRLRHRISSKVQSLIQQQSNKFTSQANKNGHKQKEKTICQVVEKVALWRKLYTGFPDQRGDPVHYQLENSANQIDVIKKTLDDYLLQIRNGKRFGFNFQKMKDGKIGELRSFVRDKKEQEEQQSKNKQ